MEKQIEEKNTEMGSVITRSEEFIQKNQKTLIICVVAVIVVILAIFGLRKWVFQPREARAAEEMFAAEQWFDQGDFEKALNGDDTYRGFLSVIDNFGGTKAANLAKYYAGVANLRLGNYDEAAKWLKKYRGKDTFTRPLAEMMLGDACIEQGNAKEAASHYRKAAKMEDNYITAPTALFKAGMAYLMLEDNAAALDCFQQVKKNYPESTEWSEIDRYIALAEAGK
ncbi:MAG: tetratricopeptide repeat protein [Bacteroidales bacterium]|nr:tetratricopeptide repeat protein [Bacteroidales bacterium]MBR6440711.1 tetratricopeptide repeat protein [Bacteroidales bacterium]